MHEENASIVEEMQLRSEVTLGSRTYHSGTLQEQPVVVVFSHWGKVAASITATTLITHFSVSEILFTGVAGALDSSLSVGDIVVATDLYQHDMDASPIIPRHEIPLLGRSEIASDATVTTNLQQAALQFVDKDLSRMVSADAIQQFNLQSPVVRAAAIASGDQFISQPADAAGIRQRLPSVACVEMEGAAVAQVAESFGVPFGILRTISDGANESSDIDFLAFVAEVARIYSVGIVKRYLAAAG